MLVTGAARRLGRETVLCFARAGWDVLVHYHHSDDAARSLKLDVQALGRRCWLLPADLAAPTAAAALLQAARDQAGVLPQCIVNNAAMFQPDAGLAVEPALLLQHFLANAATPLLLADELARQLRASGERQPDYSVVHILDQKVHNLNPDYFSYTVSKLALTQSVALQAQALAPWVRVCGVSPGLMYLSGSQTPSNFEQASRVNLRQRALAPSDVARTILFVASNPSLVGTIIVVDNGQHLVALDRDVMFAVDAALEQEQGRRQ